MPHWKQKEEKRNPEPSINNSSSGELKHQTPPGKQDKEATHITNNRVFSKKFKKVSLNSDVGKDNERRSEEDDSDKKNQNDKSNDDDDDGSGVPYDRGWAWMVVVGYFLLFLIYISHDSWTSVLLIDYTNEFNISVSVITVMLSLGSLCYCLCTIISANVLSVRFTTRNVISCAAICNVLATLLFAVAPNAATFFIVNLVKYSAKGTTLIATMILVGFYFKCRRGLATTLGLLGVSTSFICAPPLIRYLRETYGFNGCFLILAAFEMHAIPAAFLLRPLTSYRRHKVNEKHLDVEAREDNPLLETTEDNQTANHNSKERTILSQTSVIEILIEEADEVSDEDVDDDESLMRNILEEQNDLLARKEGELSTSDFNNKICLNSEVTAKNVNTLDLKLEHDTMDVKAGHDLMDGKTGHDTVSVKLGKDTVDVKLGKDTMYTSPGHDQPSYSPELILIESFGLIPQEGADNNSPGKPHNGETYSTENMATKSESKINSKMSENGNTEDFQTQTQVRQDKMAENNNNNNKVQTVLRSRHNMAVAAGYRTSHPSNWSLATTSTMGSTLNLPHVIEPQVELTKLDSHFKHFQWMKNLIDLRLLKNYNALMVIIMYILINASSFTAVYLPSYAKRVGVSSQNAAILLTIIGSMDIVGRLFFGFLADLRCVRPHVIIAVTQACIGIVTHFTMLYNGLEKLIFFSVMHGFLAGAGHTLTTVLIVDVVGLQHLSKLLSMASMFNSISMIIQHPIHGAIIEATGNFTVIYHYIGTCLLLVCLLLLCEPFIRKLQAAKEKG